MNLFSGRNGDADEENGLKEDPSFPVLLPIFFLPPDARTLRIDETQYLHLNSSRLSGSRVFSSFLPWMFYFSQERQSNSQERRRPVST